MQLIGNVTGFQHLGIPTPDIEASVRFYESIGFRIDVRSELEENSGRTHIVFMSFGFFCLELYQPAGDFNHTRLPGPINHFTMDVRDIDAAFTYFRDGGYEIIEDAPVSLPIHRGGVRYFNVLGPSGEKVEFNQLM
jgi:catechol 2,3-dioxygenase-like lactoylglutathione lyase family enzyme